MYLKKHMFYRILIGSCKYIFPIIYMIHFCHARSVMRTKGSEGVGDACTHARTHARTLPVNQSARAVAVDGGRATTRPPCTSLSAFRLDDTALMASFIQTQADAYPALSERYTGFLSLYEQKQWHQLTNQLAAFVADETAHQGENMVMLYRNFIDEFKTRINPVSLVEFAVHASTQLFPSRPYQAAELENAKGFLSEVLAFLEDGTTRNTLMGASAALCDHALFLCRAELFLFDVYNETDPVAQQVLLQRLAEQGAALDELRAPEPVVQGAHYKGAAELHRAMGNYGEFYRTGLMYLVFTPTTSSGMGWAIDLSLAALLGDGIYNFGEILTNSVLSCLVGTDHAWLRTMLEVFNSGDVDRFHATVKEHAGTIRSQHPDLLEKLPELTAKVELLALTELIFRRPAKDRTIPFADIARATKKPIDEVETLVMRAMSVGLIKGVVDGVDQVLEAQWVEPHVLDAPQIKTLSTRLGEWAGRVQETLVFIENQTPDMFKE